MPNEKTARCKYNVVENISGGEIEELCNEQGRMGWNLHSIVPTINYNYILIFEAHYWE